MRQDRCGGAKAAPRVVRIQRTRPRRQIIPPCRYSRFLLEPPSHVLVLCAPDPAVAGFDEQGRLYSPAYGDVYHSPSGALGQAEHVFLRGNGLPERWRGRDAFTVCETGFGLGLNFLALWRAWRDDPQRAHRLHVVSLEAHPFGREDLAALLARHAREALAPLAAQLAAQWPPLLPGLHRLEFEGAR